MSRPLRIEYPGAWYHVMNRGRRRKQVFRGKEDYLCFIDLLKKTSQMWQMLLGLNAKVFTMSTLDQLITHTRIREFVSASTDERT
ncbi:MAG: hypothetical protein U5R49_10920 [Deltaproteobacteria bacterium]|nr:hypothetical protein [Deltaproteobacteria bacterium]